MAVELIVGLDVGESVRLMLAVKDVDGVAVESSVAVVDAVSELESE